MLNLKQDIKLKLYNIVIKISKHNKNYNINKIN